MRPHNRYPRPRFSLRALLVLTALAAAFCYWWIARPTAVAERFVAAYLAEDSSTVNRMWLGPRPTEFDAFQSGDRQSLFRLRPGLLPRTFHDVWTGSRRIAFRWTMDGNAITFDINVATPQPVIASPLGIHWRASNRDEFGVEMGSGDVHFDQSLMEIKAPTQ
jgi:hypothetical protein